MAISTFDIFKIGIGPSSSHTVGPMRAARLFVAGLQTSGLMTRVHRVHCALHGSLGATGKGHGSDKAVLLGLIGHEPETVPIDSVQATVQSVRSIGLISLMSQHVIPWHEARDLSFYRHPLPFHPNGMKLSAWDENNFLLDERTYYSVGGGFVISNATSAEGEAHQQLASDTTQLPIPFRTGDELLQCCSQHQLSIADVMRANERFWRSDEEVHSGLMRIWSVMQDCVQRGCATDGVLPGPLKVRRRAAHLHQELSNQPDRIQTDPLTVLDWVNLFALAVNEENAAGGRVVTAPTNGAAGIVPAVLHYYWRFVPGATETGIADFLLTAAAIGILYKENASISGAEVGCQGEVGVACSMAAAALCAVLGGSTRQVENAAEIGMEHHLGLTCDPVGGLVQIPCIERNAIASVQAINAARMALRGDGTHYVSLDKVIKTMRETGADMKTKYKETSRGGLAVNIVEC